MKALVMLAVLAISVRAQAKGCHEVSHVVGYEHCTWFGTWSRDTPVVPLWIELSYYHHTFDGQAYTLDGNARSTSPSDLSATSDGGLFRILGGRVLYTGIELGGGYLTTIPQPVGAMPAMWGSSMTAHVIAGAHVALWRLGLGVEVAAGGRLAMMANCDAKQNPACVQVTATQTSRELELRARADLFITPMWSFGVVAGKSVIADNEQELLITTGFHFRALDGAP